MSISNPGNTESYKPRTAIYRQHKVVRPSWNETYNALVNILLSQRINPLCQQGAAEDRK